jgi:hypothetical protein
LWKEIVWTHGGSIGTRRIEHREQTKDLPIAISFFNRNSQRSETSLGEIHSSLSENLGIFDGAFAHFKDPIERTILTRWICLEQSDLRVGGSLGASVSNSTSLNDGSDPLGNRVERRKALGGPSGPQDLLSFRVVLQGGDGDFVNRVQALDVVRGSQGGDGHHPVDINSVRDEWFVDGKLVGSQGTGL